MNQTYQPRGLAPLGNLIGPPLRPFYAVRAKNSQVQTKPSFKSFIQKADEGVSTPTTISSQSKQISKCPPTPRSTAKKPTKAPESSLGGAATARKEKRVYEQTTPRRRGYTKNFTTLRYMNRRSGRRYEAICFLDRELGIPAQFGGKVIPHV
eukprot:TRINITY_DN7314_c0_g1_i4.p1 TRINITY_DN7314_c0_g1~~TRINITY_DN7314_c0_g1_i4.p1  ORF type:complete len:152 (-),score=26.80 TRINITY_DN7314_c0_g1_i4:184-639(-)